MRLPDPPADWLETIEDTAKDYRNAKCTLNRVTPSPTPYNSKTDTGGGLVYTTIWSGMSRTSLMGNNESYSRNEWNVRARYHIDIAIRDATTGIAVPKIEKGMVFIFSECPENPQLVGKALYVHSVSLGSQVSQLDIIASGESVDVGA